MIRQVKLHRRKGNQRGDRPLSYHRPRLPAVIGRRFRRPGTDDSYVVSRRFNALALGAVAADFAIKYLCTERADHLVGLVVFTILTARTLLLLCFETIEAEVFRRHLTCAAAFFACAVASVASELAATGSLALVTLLPLVGIGLGCLGEASNAMVVRRRCVLAMGCIMSLFAISTGAWGVVFKNTISDVGASIWSMIKSRDPPLPALASVIGFRP